MERMLYLKDLPRNTPAAKVSLNAIRVLVADGDLYTADPVESTAMLATMCFEFLANNVGLDVAIGLHEAIGRDLQRLKE